VELKKILIISRSFYPAVEPRAFRATQLVKEFSRQGHDVTLLTVKNENIHGDFEKKYGVKIKDLGKLRLPVAKANSKNKFIRLFQRGVSRLLLQLFEYPNIEFLQKVSNALKSESGYDLLISVAVPHPIHWGVARARKKYGRIADVWVADCGDPFMGQDMDSFKKRFYFKYFEKGFCRKADYISVPMEGAKEGYYPEFHDKMKVIPQGFDFDEVKIEPKNYTKNNIPTFAYAGSFAPGSRDPRAILNLLTDLEEPYKFIIYTKTDALIRPYLDQSDGRIELRDTIPRTELLVELSKMDFLVNFKNRSNLMMPSKLIDYYLTGRPVLQVEHNNDVNREKVVRFLNGDYSGKYAFLNMDRFRIEKVCRQFLELI